MKPNHPETPVGPATPVAPDTPVGPVEPTAMREAFAKAISGNPRFQPAEPGTAFVIVGARRPTK